jgi:polyisoprenyl-phosphate glycosyltransferase
LMDADLQDLPEELPRLLEPFNTNQDLDIAYTTFELETGQKSRFTSKFFHRFFAYVSNVHIPLNLGTYRVFSKLVRSALLEYPERQAVYGPIMAQLGFENVYVTVSRANPAGRRSSYTFRKRLSLAISSLISYSSILHRFVVWVGATLTFASAGYLVLVVVQYIAGYRVLVNGQLLLLLTTTLMSGVLLMTVGVLTAYTYRIFHEVLGRPRYHIAREFGIGILGEKT